MAQKAALDDWDRLYLFYERASRAFYLHKRRAQALKHCATIKPVLRKLASQHKSSISVQTAAALFWHVRGDLNRAMRHRESEISLLRTCRRLSPHGLEHVLKLC